MAKRLNEMSLNEQERSKDRRSHLNICDFGAAFMCTNVAQALWCECISLNAGIIS